jgi:hypothetical protein
MSIHSDSFTTSVALFSCLPQVPIADSESHEGGTAAGVNLSVNMGTGANNELNLSSSIVDMTVAFCQLAERVAIIGDADTSTNITSKPSHKTFTLTVGQVRAGRGD